jgi:type IX secretion system PorP/SprF family membrane protein
MDFFIYIERSFLVYRRIFLSLALLYSISVLISAQDIHFTQIQASPLQINPANTGVTYASLRLVNNYRNQWRTIEAPYNTIGVSLDKGLHIRNQNFGIGGLMLHDVSSPYELSVNKFYLSAGYSKFYRNHQFSVGLQPGMVFKHINTANLTFHSQFDQNTGQFDPSLPSNEDNLQEKATYFDLNFGFLWRARIRNFRPSAGFSVFHLTRPVEGFFSGIDSSRLAFRYNLHGSVLIPLPGNFDITPAILYSAVPGSNAFIGGGILGFSLENPLLAIQRIYTLGLFRANPARNFDALMIGAGLQSKRLEVAVSYDMNLSSIRKVNNFYGAFEVSLIFRSIIFKSKDLAEPCYML